MLFLEKCSVFGEMCCFLEKCAVFGEMCCFWINVLILDKSAVLGWMCCFWISVLFSSNPRPTYILTVSFYALSYSTAELVERLVDGRNFRHPFSILLNHVISKTNFTKCIDIVLTILLSGTWQLRCENNWYRLLVKYFVYLSWVIALLLLAANRNTVPSGPGGCRGLPPPPILADMLTLTVGRLRLPHYVLLNPSDFQNFLRPCYKNPSLPLKLSHPMIGDD